MIKAVAKKILPNFVIHKLKQFREKLASPEEKRALSIGLNKKEFKRFLEDPDAAANTKELFLFGARKKTKFLKESKAFIIESVFEDAYQLEKIPLSRDKHCKILDIGANVGAFAIAARTHFHHATIHCYEPNASLEEYLQVQAFDVQARYFLEAVGSEEGFFASDERQNEALQSKSVRGMDFTKPGEIKTITLSTAIERMGGYVDILKLDCEGSEWVILKDKKALEKVNYLTLEFHRMSPDGAFDPMDRSTDMHQFAREFVENAGFEILVSRYHSIDSGIFLAKRKS